MDGHSLALNEVPEKLFAPARDFFDYHFRSCVYANMKGKAEPISLDLFPDRDNSSAVPNPLPSIAGPNLDGPTASSPQSPPVVTPAATLSQSPTQPTQDLKNAPVPLGTQTPQKDTGPIQSPGTAGKQTPQKDSEPSETPTKQNFPQMSDSKKFPGARKSQRQSTPLPFRLKRTRLLEETFSYSSDRDEMFFQV